MFTNKSESGLNNLCGQNIAEARKKLNISQRELADKMQLYGLDMDKNTVHRIECGKRFVTDIELAQFSKFFRMSCDELVTES